MLDVGVAESGFEQRGSAFSIARWRFTFNGHVEITSEFDSAKLDAQIADLQQQRNAYGFCLAHSLLM